MAENMDKGYVPTTTEEIRANDGSLIADFIAEGREHLHRAEIMLLSLEGDPGNKDVLDTIFRSWHSLKGLAGFLNVREIALLAHLMENRMDLARKGVILIDPVIVDCLLAANDCLKSLIDAVETAFTGEPYSIPGTFEAARDCMTDSSAKKTENATELLPTDKKIGEILVDAGFATEKDVLAALVKQEQGDERKLGEILMSDKEVTARELGSALAAQNTGRKSVTAEETIRVPVNRIDLLVDAIGEAIIAQSLVNMHHVVTGAGDQQLHTNVGHANTILRQIQQLSMSLRMVSVKATFQKMARLARDLAKKCNRDIDFITEGEDTELDKSVVENISDPLVHMIRNAIDHGIEPQEDRIAKGKPIKATVRLAAFHRAGAIYIEITDDGRGLDKDKIFSKAVSRNLCKPDASLTEQEIFQFIFLPGFSTAQQVTDISGRGVGMDVVRRNIEQLRGSVEISSTVDKGTTFTIKLPLTLAVVDGMVVIGGDERFIIPTLSIIESVQSSGATVGSIGGKGRMVGIRGEYIPLVNLKELLGGMKSTTVVENPVYMIIEDMLGRKIGLELDRIAGQQQVVIKSLGEGIGDVPGVTGGAILSDGTVCLILDAGGIIKLAGEKMVEVEIDA